MNQSPWKNFKFSELACKCGKCDSKGQEMDAAFMEKIQKLRDEYGFPLTVSSAYRCPQHPAERRKASPGEHTTGMAIDIACDYNRAHEILTAACKIGFLRIGINQKGNGRFIHLGDSKEFPNPTIWSY